MNKVVGVLSLSVDVGSLAVSSVGDMRNNRSSPEP